MSDHHDNNAPEIVVKPADPAKIRKLWKVAGILGVITAIEFLFAFTVPRGTFLTVMFVIMTIMKAFYIVAEFMHLKHEVRSLMLSIILPMAFVVWLLVALIVEGGKILGLR